MSTTWFPCLAIFVLASVISGSPTSPATPYQAIQLKRVPKQVGVSPGAVSTSKDHAGAETGFGGGHGFGHGSGLDHGHHAHGHDGKYFMYANNPAYNEYEFGYRRGNDYHFQERYEKAHDWNFKTKVKWGDKYGGYGEHYWDYNHADKGHDGGHGGSGGGGGGGGGGGEGYGHDGHGHYSEPVPSYEANGKRPRGDKAGLNKRESKRNRQGDLVPTASESAPIIPRLSLDRVTGKVTDETSGRTYYLQPVV